MFFFFSKFAWFISLKDRNGETINKAFQKFVKDLNSTQTKYGLKKIGNVTTRH